MDVRKKVVLRYITYFLHAVRNLILSLEGVVHFIRFVSSPVNIKDMRKFYIFCFHEHL